MSNISKESTDGMAHSIIGASSSHRWIHCPGSVQMSKKAPRSLGSSYAQEGTAAHELAEKCLISKKKPKDFKGTKINGFLVNDDMINAVDEYVSLVREESIGMEVSIEVKFNLSWLYPGMFGTNDACAQGNGILRVYDYKHGAGIAVDVEDNSQLVYYAIGAAWDYRYKKWKEFKKIEMIIVQPRAWHKEGGVRRWSITMKELKQWAKKLKSAAQMTTWEDAPLFAGDHCKWCPAAGMCPILYQKAQDAAKTDFENPMPDATTLSMDQVAKVVKHAKTVRAFLSACEDIAFRTQLSGKRVDGLKLIRMRGSRQWFDEEALKKELSDLQFEELHNIKLKTPAQLEKIAGKERVKDFIVSKEGGLKIVPESEKGKEVIIDMALEFKE